MAFARALAIACVVFSLAPVTEGVSNDFLHPTLIAVETSAMHKLAALEASGEGGVSWGFMLINILVLAGFTYWAYQEHQKIKSENKEPKMGLKSILCCFTCFCCFGCGTPVGLCFPFDEPDDNSKKEAKASVAAS
mmetsp:Transcript_67953/g.106924  ORF Transcript_67953/g.106924 Transcript_67953/m.106924 type:complete len:135 (+) Transcript_67953:80-484(+)